MLRQKGFPVSEEEYRHYTHAPSRGGWKSLNYLVDKGVIDNHMEFMGLLAYADDSIRYPEYPHPGKAIALIGNAGGCPILAHPYSGFSAQPLDEILFLFGELAIAGFECYHPQHTVKSGNRWLEFCTRHGLLITGGSDCHGDFLPDRHLGSPVITIDRLTLGPLLRDS
jgi:hypothetical protein